MRYITGLIVLFSALLLAPRAGIAATVQYSVTTTGDVTPSGHAVHRLTFDFSGFTLNAWQEIEIRLIPTYFVSIFNPTGDGPDFSVITLQVNNPPGAAGTYSMVALIDNPEFTGPFSVDAVLTGSVPASVPYNINQLDSQFAFVERIASESAHITTTPEPASIGCVAFGIVVAALTHLRRNRSPQGRTRD